MFTLICIAFIQIIIWANLSASFNMTKGLGLNELGLFKNYLNYFLGIFGLGLTIIGFCSGYLISQYKSDAGDSILLNNFRYIFFTSILVSSLYLSSLMLLVAGILFLLIIKITPKPHKFGNYSKIDQIKNQILPMRERAELRNQILKDRFKTVLPDIMRRNNIDMWIIIAREYNEDPVIRTMLPATWLNARRRTILVVHDPGNNKSLEGYAIARYDVGDMFIKSWDPEKQPNQYQALSES